MRAQTLRQHAPAIFVLICLTFLICMRAAFGQAGSSTSALRITSPIDETRLVRLAGNTHPLALPKFDRGAVADSYPMQHMYLELQRSPQQEQALATLLADMENPSSPNYHHWLTPDQLVRQVIQGGGNMPAYGKNLSPPETAALVKFLETLHPARQAPARDASRAIAETDQH